MWCITKWQIPIERRKCPFVRTNQHEVPQQLQAHAVPWEGICLLWQQKKKKTLYRENLCPVQRGLGAQPTAPEDLHSVGAGLGVWEGAQHSKSSALSRQARLAPWDKGSSVSTLSVGGRVLVSLDFSWAVHEGQLPLHVPPEQGRVGPPATCLCVLDNKLWNDFWFRILWSLSELTHSTNSA